MCNMQMNLIQELGREEKIALDCDIMITVIVQGSLYALSINVHRMHCSNHISQTKCICFMSFTAL